MASYFNYFPTILYANNAVTNIFAKVKFNQSVQQNLAVFYPYTVKEGERPDQIAESYYEDANYDWIVYLSNDIVDPYHDWPKEGRVFDQFIIDKYGSLANAQLQIAYYKVNYGIDESVITTARYDALATNQKQYWSPIVDRNDQVKSYERKQLDKFSDTNKIISLTGTFGGIAVNNVLKQSATVSGTVSFANSSTLVLKHVSGTWNNTSPISFSLSNTSANATVTTVTTISTPISAEELVYWSPVTRYEEEVEINENKRQIRLLSAAYVDLVERDMKALLQK